MFFLFLTVSFMFMAHTLMLSHRLMHTSPRSLCLQESDVLDFTQHTSFTTPFPHIYVHIWNPNPIKVIFTNASLHRTVHGPLISRRLFVNVLVYPTPLRSDLKIHILFFPLSLSLTHTLGAHHVLHL